MSKRLNILPCFISPPSPIPSISSPFHSTSFTLSSPFSSFPSPLSLPLSLLSLTFPPLSPFPSLSPTSSRIRKRKEEITRTLNKRTSKKIDQNHFPIPPSSISPGPLSKVFLRGGTIQFLAFSFLLM